MRIVKVSEEQREEGDVEKEIPLRRYTVSWQETYEMETVIHASSLEEAMVRAGDCRADTPSLTEWCRWGTADQDVNDYPVSYSEVLVGDDLLEVFAYFETAGQLECLPWRDEEKNDG